VIVSIVADRNKGFALGAAAVMQKPISRQELYDSLTDLDLIPLEPGTELRILVIDDDPAEVDLIEVYIDGLAGKFLRAYGGREGIEIAKRKLPDLIVLDLMMPDVNGFDVVAVLHDDPGTESIPILVVTAKQISAEDRDKLNGFVSTVMEKGDFDAGSDGLPARVGGTHIRAAGCDGYIAKPLAYKEFLTTIAAELGKRAVVR